MIPNQKPVSFDEKQSDAFAILVHNLQNLLTGIYFFSEYMTGETLEEGEKTEMAQEMFANVKSSIDICLNLYFAHRLNHADDNLLESTHLNAGEVINKAVQHYEILARKKRITLLASVQDRLWIEADADLLQFVIENLISNAIKFTAEGGAVTITAAEQDGQLLIVVEDSGKGIEPEMQQHVFQLGLRATYGTDNEKGAGIGLYLCSQFIRQLAGSIDFQSTPEHGSRFVLRLPLRSL